MRTSPYFKGCNMPTWPYLFDRSLTIPNTAAITGLARREKESFGEIHVILLDKCRKEIVLDFLTVAQAGFFYGRRTPNWAAFYWYARSFCHFKHWTIAFGKYVHRTRVFTSSQRKKNRFFQVQSIWWSVVCLGFSSSVELSHTVIKRLAISWNF